MEHNEKKAGYVYILTNPSFKDNWVKIGKSSRSVDVRSKELDNTAVPLPFEIYATLQTVKYDEVERLVHRTIDRLSDFRVRQNREFFNVPPEEALGILKDIAATLDDGVIDEVYKHPKERVEVDEEEEEIVEHDGTRKQRAPFKFSMVGLKIGDEIVFEQTGRKFTIVTDNKVEFDGRFASMSGVCGALMPNNKRNRKDAYQGPKYFSYRGELLTDMRNRMEGMNGGIDDKE